MLPFGDTDYNNGDIDNDNTDDDDDDNNDNGDIDDDDDSKEDYIDNYGDKDVADNSRRSLESDGLLVLRKKRAD